MASPAPPGPVSDPGPVSMVGGMSNQPAGRTAIVGWMRAADARVTAQVFHDVMTTDMRGELAAVTAPVTLLYAQDDSLMPAERAKVAFEPQYIGVAKFTAQMVPGSRHFIMLDQPRSLCQSGRRLPRQLSDQPRPTLGEPSDRSLGQRQPEGRHSMFKRLFVDHPKAVR